MVIVTAESKTQILTAAVNQMFGGSSQLPTTAERAVIMQIVELSSDNETVNGSSRKLEGAAEHLLDGGERKHMSVKLGILESARH